MRAFLFSFFFGSTVAMAQEAATSGANTQPSIFESMIPFLIILVLMYFLLIRPQVKKSKEHSNLLGSLQVGDEVVTSGGIIGRIKSISDAFIVLDLGSTTVKILKENITRLTHPKQEAPVSKVPAKEK